MVKNAIGIVLMIVAAVITFMLVTGGGPLVPHIVGPITLVVVGVILLTRKKNSERSAQ